VDLTRVSPIVEGKIEDLTVGRAAIKAGSSKVTKHKKSISTINIFLYHLSLTLLVL
jgi:hypothetical protein